MIRYSLTLWFWLLMICFPVAQALDTPHGWSPITDKVRKICTEKSQCIVSQRKNKSSYQILFTTKIDKMIWLEAVTIKDQQSAQLTSYKKLKNMQGLFLDEGYQLYAVDLNGDDFLDLALQASNSLHAGYFYFYWLYDPVRKDFVLTEEQLPGLIAKGKNIAFSPYTQEVYRIENYHLVIKKPKKG